MNTIIGKKVKLTKLGKEGVLESIDNDGRFIVCIDQGKEKKAFPYYFNGHYVNEYLEFQESSVQAVFLHKVEEDKNKRLEQETARINAEGEVKSAKNTGSNTYKPRNREGDHVRPYLVFQGISFNEESQQGCIKSPKEGRHFWERLSELQEGDLIIHCAGRRIMAVSMVVGKSRDCVIIENPRPCHMVSCDYHILENPIAFGQYRSEILARRGDPRYCPFDSNGNGVRGYLFELDIDLARFFLDRIITMNPEVDQLNYVKPFVL